jgi:hypothetical protein
LIPTQPTSVSQQVLEQNFYLPLVKEKSEILELEGVKIPVIGYDHLVQLKMMTNRLKDKADVEEFLKRHRSDRNKNSGFDNK